MKAFLAAVLLPLVAASAGSSSIRIPVVQDDIKFNSGVSTIKSSQVGDLLSALNGYTVDPATGWSGLRSYNPLRHPKLFLVAEVGLFKGMSELTLNSNLHFKLDDDKPLASEFESLKARSVARWPEAETSMQYVDSGADSQDAERIRQAKELVNDELFDTEKAADRSFLLEYATLKDVVSKVSSASSASTAGPSTVFWVRLGSLKALAQAYGASDKKVERATQLFTSLVGTATGILETQPRALFMVIQEVESEAKRVKREEPAAAEGAPAGAAANPLADADWNLAHQYDSEFHVVFAITGFTMLIIVLGVFATSVGLWFMDPGRDSIIYRMTSQRIKMD